MNLEALVDGHLQSEANSGNKEAIRQMAGLSAKHLDRLLRHFTGPNGVPAQDDLVMWLSEALRQMADGKSPDVAFGWTIRPYRPLANSAYLEQAVADHVQDLTAEGTPKGEACLLVGQAAHMDGSKNGKVDKAHLKFYDEHGNPRGDGLSPNLFPVPPDDHQAVERLDENIAKVREKMARGDLNGRE